jgi:membrane protease YdiL (CAAX protease family)
MVRSGSAPPAKTLPAAIAILAMVVGTLGMVLTGLALGRRAGLRPTLLLSEVVLVLPGLLALAAWRLPWREALRLRRIGGAATALSVAAGLTLWVASLGLLELQYAIWAPPPEYLRAFRSLHQALRPTGPADAVLSVTAIALLPALCEELLVRGIVLPSLARVMGAAGAVLGSATLFGLMHLDPYRFPFTLAVGVVLGMVRLRTASLVPPILAHAALNALTFVAVPWLDDPGVTMPPPRPLLGAALLMLGALLSWSVVRPLRPERTA